MFFFGPKDNATSAVESLVKAGLLGARGDGCGEFVFV